MEGGKEGRKKREEGGKEGGRRYKKKQGRLWEGGRRRMRE